MDALWGGKETEREDKRIIEGNTRDREGTEARGELRQVEREMGGKGKRGRGGG